jgi:hypothetical protein
MPYLPIYLNDHLAGAVVGVELVRRMCASNQDDEAIAPDLLRVAAEVEEDRATLEQVLGRLDVSRSPVKPVAAWLIERVGRLKPNGHLRGYSPLSRVLELEGLAMGITGKIDLWRTLSSLGLAERSEVDFDALAERAEKQRAVVNRLHDLAVAAIPSEPTAAGR